MDLKREVVFNINIVNFWLMHVAIEFNGILLNMDEN
jgi:hypothetical protein